VTFTPARHLMAQRWNQTFGLYGDEPEDGSDPPVPIDAHVPAWRAAIRSGPVNPSRWTSPDPAGEYRSVTGVVLPHAHVRVVCDLLHELAKRLRPGLAVGPIESDGSLNELATELAGMIRAAADAWEP
jgi:hypothetical protein